MKKIIILALVIVAFAACNSSINPMDLYGKWKYIKVEKPHARPPDSVSSAELKSVEPYIQFAENNTIAIVWGGKVLSNGKFTVKGRSIQYTEQLPDGTTRKFPFWVLKFADDQIVFETTGEDGSRVTAVKEQ